MTSLEGMARIAELLLQNGANVGKHSSCFFARNDVDLGRVSIRGRKVIQINYNRGQKSWNTFAFLGRFPIQTDPTPPLTPQTMLDALIQNFFRVSTLYRVGGGRTARKF